MPRKARPKLKLNPDSLSFTLQMVSDDIYNTRAAINKQLNLLQLKTQTDEVTSQINKLLELQTILIQKRLDLSKEQKYVIERNFEVNNEPDPTEIKYRNIPKQPDDTLPLRFYVYYHKNNNTGEIFYVGKGSGNRAYIASSRTNDWKKYVMSINYDYSVIIHKDDLDEHIALNEEQDFILECAKKGYNIVNKIPNKILRRHGLVQKRIAPFQPVTDDK